MVVKPSYLRFQLVWMWDPYHRSEQAHPQRTIVLGPRAVASLGAKNSDSAPHFGLGLLPPNCLLFSNQHALYHHRQHAQIDTEVLTLGSTPTSPIT